MMEDETMSSERSQSNFINKIYKFFLQLELTVYAHFNSFNRFGLM